MTKPKYCKDCKFCKPTRLMQILSLGMLNPYEFATCSRPISDNLVDGKPKLSFCENQRVDYDSLDTCGTNAKYFEARK
jgi:hypothetical protein